MLTRQADLTWVYSNHWAATSVCSGQNLTKHQQGSDHEAAQPWTRRQTRCCHFRKKLSEIVEAETRDFGEKFLLKNFSMPLKLMEVVSSIIGLERWLNWPSFDTIMSYSTKLKALSVKQQPLLLCDGILQHCKITTVITFRVEICKNKCRRRVATPLRLCL